MSSPFFGQDDLPVRGPKLIVEPTMALCREELSAVVSLARGGNDPSANS